jgi:hypothetical protein
MPNLNDPPRKGRFDPAIEDKRLRDQFAGRAMEGLIAKLEVMQASTPVGSTLEDFIADLAWSITDSMMTKRNEK